MMMLMSLLLSGCGFFPKGTSSGTRAARDVAVASKEVDSGNRVGRHLYAGLGVGSSHLDPDSSRAPGYDVNDRVNTAGQLTLGMDLSKQFSIEANAAELGSAGFSPSGRISYKTYGLSALVYAGKNRHNFKRRGFTGYGRLGVALLEND